MFDQQSICRSPCIFERKKFPTTLKHPGGQARENLFDKLHALSIISNLVLNTHVQLKNKYQNVKSVNIANTDMKWQK
jgi:hypothetical protein